MISERQLRKLLAVKNNIFVAILYCLFFITVTHRDHCHHHHHHHHHHRHRHHRHILVCSHFSVFNKSGAKFDMCLSVHRRYMPGKKTN
jgi:hypothetical protein